MARIRLAIRWRMTISFARHQFPPVIIRHAVWLYLRFTLSYPDVEDLVGSPRSAAICLFPAVADLIGGRLGGWFQPTISISKIGEPSKRRRS
jgi:hypothetical protein